MLSREARQRLEDLANERLPPADAAWKLLEFHEREGGKKPLEAILTAENDAWEMGLAPGDEFWDQVVGAIETIRDEDEPLVEVYFSDGGPESEPGHPYVIGRYRDETEGQFGVEWVPIDPWRGYAALRPAGESSWLQVHDDVILVGSADERALKVFDDEIQKYMDRQGIRYVRGFARTSNIFTTGYTLFVEQAREEEMAQIVEQLKARYRDPARFAKTALGWERPEEGARWPGRWDPDQADHAGLCPFGRRRPASMKTRLPSRKKSRYSPSCTPRSSFTFLGRVS